MDLRRSIAVALTATGFLVAVPVASAEPSRTSDLSSAAPFAWEGAGVTGTPVVAVTDDDTLLDVTQDGKLTVALSGANDTAIDLDVYIYKSNEAGEAIGDPIKTGEEGGSEERVSIDVVAGFHLVRVTGWASLDGTYAGKATLVAVAPPPVPTAPTGAVAAPTDLLPEARLGRLPKGRAKRTLVFRGTASDDKGVSRVELAVVRRSGGKCAQLTSKGKFRSLARCNAPTSFLRATGTTTWSLTIKNLPKASYTIFARAFDSVGQKQAGFSAANRKSFKVR